MRLLRVQPRAAERLSAGKDNDDGNVADGGLSRGNLAAARPRITLRLRSRPRRAAAGELARRGQPRLR